MAFVAGVLRRLLLVMCALVASLAFSGLAMATTVIVRGSTNAAPSSIQNYFQGTSPDQINAGIKALYATGRFANVSVRREGNRLVVNLVDNKRINHVAFEGNSKIKDAQLKSQIQSRSGGAFDPGLVAADVAAIKEAYVHGGHNDATVSDRIVNLPDGRVDVVFEIKEGDKTGVREIHFVGNHAFSDGTLRGIMSTTEMNFLSWLKTSDVYDPDKLATDEDHIRRYYLKNGYIDFRITGSDVHYDAAKKGYIITISMQEGPQYRIGSVNVVSNVAGLQPATLQNKLLVSAGEIYNGDEIQKTAENLTRAADEAGYPFAQVHPQGDRNPAARTVAVHFAIDPGQKAYIEKIQIRGNDKTRDYVIRREFDIGEGDAYNQVLIDQAKRRLEALGFFKKVTITAVQGSAPDKVIVDVDVVEKASGSFAIGGGYSTTDGFLASASISDSNFLGRGQFVKLSVSRGQYSSAYEASFTQPYFLGYRMSGTLDVYRKEQSVNVYSTYQTIITGVTTSLGIPLTDQWSVSPHYSLYETQIYIPNTAAQPYNDCTLPLTGVTPSPPTATNNCLTNGEASLAVKESQGRTLTSLGGVTLTYNTLDNPKDPRDGILGSITEDVAGLGGKSKFIRTTGDLRVFHPLTDDFVGVLHFQAGDIYGYGGHKLRLADNFNMGDSLVRGFAPGGIGPRDNSPGVNPQTNSLGGTTYLGASAELQFPIFGTPRELGLRGAVFADAGTLFGYQGQTQFAATCTPNDQAPTYTQGTCISVQDSHKIRTSVGASILWASPLGPIRINYAIPLTKAPGDQTQAFSFSGGASF
ncbi:MAG: outer membrane protein assembly factor BamA [Hyphomicrobiales bacterium]|nr:outer membrane protein assembly factor BamA [Hyphomicrobiales bacterium]